MKLDKFLSSQTFKTGTFVIVVFLIALFIFKAGMFHGYKKAIYVEKYGGANYTQVHGGSFWNHHKMAGDKSIRGKFIFKKKLMGDKALIDSEAGDDVEDVEI